MLPHLEAGSAFATCAPRLDWWLRALLMAVGGLAIALLITAACLPPSPNGFGTHQQLGLPPCSLIALVGIRCPSCGMTTSWAHMLRGHVWQSFASNSGGALLALAACMGGPWALLSGLRGRWLGGIPNEWTFAGLSLAIMAITLLDWSVRLYIEHGR